MDGQPVWVTILLYAVGVAAALGIAYLTTKYRNGSTSAPPTATVTTTTSENSVQLGIAAMDHLADSAKRAEKMYLAEKKRADALQEALERCQKHTLLLARQAVDDDEQRRHPPQ